MSTWQEVFKDKDHAVNHSFSSLAVRYGAVFCHTAMAITFTVLLFVCKSSSFDDPGTYMLPLDWQAWRNSSHAPMNASCTSAEQCYRNSLPWAEDELLAKHAWNPFMLCCGFEWLSAAFAIFYLRHNFREEKSRRGASALALLCCVLNLVLVSVWHVVYAHWYWMQILVMLASSLVSVAIFLTWDKFETAVAQKLPEPHPLGNAVAFEKYVLQGRVWRVPTRVKRLGEPRRLRQYTLLGVHDNADHDGPDTTPFLILDSQSEIHAFGGIMKLRLRVVLRYMEYCMTASMLYVAVLSMLVVSPPAWTYVAGFFGIFACNATGIALHLKTLDIAFFDHELHAKGHTKRALLDVIAGVGTFSSPGVAKLSLLWDCWIGLFIGLYILVWFAQGALYNTSVPLVARIMIWWLFVNYSAFGVVATVIYVKDAWWVYMDRAMDVLSISAKVGITGTIAAAFMTMPGAGCYA